MRGRKQMMRQGHTFQTRPAGVMDADAVGKLTGRPYSNPSTQGGAATALNRHPSFEVPLIRLMDEYRP